MRFNYKEIGDYKIIFEDKEEFLLDTLKSESIHVEFEEVTVRLKDALFNKELINKISTTKISHIKRIIKVRDEKSGKDIYLEYILYNPKVTEYEYFDAEGGYTFSNFIIKTKKFEIA